MGVSLYRWGACRQAERKVCPSTREPDVGNANEGMRIEIKGHIFMWSFV